MFIDGFIFCDLQKLGHQWTVKNSFMHSHPRIYIYTLWRVHIWRNIFEYSITSRLHHACKCSQLYGIYNFNYSYQFARHKQWHLWLQEISIVFTSKFITWSPKVVWVLLTISLNVTTQVLVWDSSITTLWKAILWNIFKKISKG
jgi:hypothetical protein